MRKTLAVVSVIAVPLLLVFIAVRSQRQIQASAKTPQRAPLAQQQVVPSHFKNEPVEDCVNDA